MDKTLEEPETVRRTTIAEEKKRDYDSTAVLFENQIGFQAGLAPRKNPNTRWCVAERDIAAELVRRRIIARRSPDRSPIFTSKSARRRKSINRSCGSWTPRIAILSAIWKRRLPQRLKRDQVETEVETGARPSA